MSTIFTSTPVCEICQSREPKKDSRDRYQSRCEYCDLRHDSQGQPYIVYCEIYVFEIRKDDRQCFWILDGEVGRAFGRWKHLEGVPIEQLMVEMKKLKYRLVDHQEPVFK